MDVGNVVGLVELESTVVLGEIVDVLADVRAEVVLLSVDVAVEEPAPEITETVLIPKLVTNTSPMAESYAAAVGYSPAVTVSTTVLLFAAITDTM